jgi:raffinose/stachyose/melibiose transport system substrate-binding protein
MYLPGMIPENATRPINGMNRVAQAFEERFPDTRIEVVGVAAESREWLVTQLVSGQAPDVIQINVEDVWQDIHKGWYVQLDKYLDSPNPFTERGQPGSEKWWDVFKYPIPTRGTMAPDGHMYCIVLDMIETGIFYNKSLFAKLGLREPRDWEEFLAVQKAVKDNGYTPMLVDRRCIADWGVDLMFDQVYGDLRDLLDLNYDPRRGEYLHGYLDWDELIFLHRKGFFSSKDPRWLEVWRILKSWRPYMSQDLNPTGTDFVKSFSTEEGAMFWSTSMTVNRLVADPDRSFDFGIFYLPPVPSSYSKFARGRNMCVIGGSGMQYCVTKTSFADTGDPDTSERLKRVIAFLQFLTTPANCDAVVNEQIALLPNVKGVDPHPELMPFDGFLQRNYSMTKWLFTFDNQWNEVLSRMLEMYLNDGLDDLQFAKVLEQDLNRATRRIEKRKSLDIGKFEAVWESRAALRKQFHGLPDDAK